eukprot:5537810-Amphidinium_carterae.1
MSSNSKQWHIYVAEGLHRLLDLQFSPVLPLVRMGMLAVMRQEIRSTRRCEPCQTHCRAQITTVSQAYNSRAPKKKVVPSILLLA